jgi:hypothetical protein
MIGGGMCELTSIVAAKEYMARQTWIGAIVINYLTFNGLEIF